LKNTLDLNGISTESNLTLEDLHIKWKLENREKKRNQRKNEGRKIKELRNGKYLTPKNESGLHHKFIDFMESLI